MHTFDSSVLCTVYRTQYNVREASKSLSDVARPGEDQQAHGRGELAAG